MLFLLAGGVALSGHSAEAAVRLAVNHSPEPFSNIALSLVEDTSVAGSFYMLVKHPWVMAGIALVFFALFAWLAPRIYRALRAQWVLVEALVRNWCGKVRELELTPNQQQWLAEHFPGAGRPRLFHVISTADTKGLHNRVGTLCLTGREAVFFARRWGRLVARQIGPLLALEARRRLLLDQLVIVTAGGRRVRFGMLAGQLESVRDEARRRSQSPPVT